MKVRTNGNLTVQGWASRVRETMDNSWFFEKFELIAELPDAIPRMRELVLKLAMQGKLVGQDPDDGDAKILLSSIIEGNRFIKSKQKRSASKDSEKESKSPFVVPNNWKWTTLGTIASWGSGSTPPRGEIKYYGGDITWLKSGELNDNKQLEGSEEKVTQKAIDDCTFRQNQAGDVLFAMYGATVGKVAILAEPAVTNQAVCGCSPCNIVSNLFLFYYLISERRNFRFASEGGAQPNFSKDKILVYPFPLPPLSEQHRIVSKVEELLGICDRLEVEQREREVLRGRLVSGALKRIRDTPSVENLGYLFHGSYGVSPSDLRKTILTLAVQGKLVPQDPKDEPAEELLETISHMRANKLNGKANPEIENEFLDLPACLPDGWKLSRFNRIAEVESNLVKPEEFPDFLHVAPDNIQKGTGVLLPCQTVKEDKVVSSKHRFYPGQILYSKIRPNLSKVVIVDFDGLCSADMYPINAYIDAQYLKLFILSDVFLKQAVKTDTRVAMPKINQNELNAILILVPPLSEQRRIVAKVEELMTMVDELEQMELQTRQRSASLLDAIVHRLSASAG